MFLIVYQQHAWKVLAQCANSRVRASVGTSSVLTLDMSVPTLERKPCSGLADGMAESEQIDLWRVGGRCCVSMCSSVLYYQLDFSLYVVAGR